LLQLLETRNELGFYFSETITTTDAIRTECFQLLVTFQNMGVQISAELVNNISIMTMEQANNLVTAQALQVIGALPEEARQLNTLTTKELLENRRSRVLNLLAFLETFQTELQIGVTDSAAAAIVYLKKLPQKLSPIINSIMTALKREQNALIQRRAAESMSVLMQLIKDRQPSPNPTVIKQLAGMLIQDLSDLLQTQERLELNSSSTIEIRASAADAVKKRKAPEPDLSLSSQLQRSGAHPASSPTQPSQAKKRKIEVDEDAMSAAAAIQSQLSESLLARRGAQFALEECARLFGDQLLTDLPALNTLIAEGLFAPLSVPLDKQTASLMAVRTLATSVKPSVRPFLLQCMDHIIPRVSANDSTLRAISSATLCVVVKHTMPKSMSIILKNLLPVLQDASNVSARRGAAMALHGSY
jgi:TATA-binding protein-associated factor